MPQVVFVTLFFFFAMAVLLIFFNNIIVVKKFSISVEDALRDTRIVLLSDLHNKGYNDKTHYLIPKIEKLTPDIIVFAGDLVDAASVEVKEGVGFLNRLQAIAPTYYVQGNHEKRAGTFGLISAELEGVRALCDETVILNDYALLGLDDPSGGEFSRQQELLGRFEALEGLKIVVCHRPEHFSGGISVSDYNIDLMLSGHTHGGAVRIPFFGAVFVPGQGFFPKYDIGIYSRRGSKLVISGGLGNSRHILRFFNFPQITMIDVKRSGHSNNKPG